MTFRKLSTVAVSAKRRQLITRVVNNVTKMIKNMNNTNLEEEMFLEETRGTVSEYINEIIEMNYSSETVSLVCL